jgi:hypothetical protein
VFFNASHYKTLGMPTTMYQKNLTEFRVSSLNNPAGDWNLVQIVAELRESREISHRVRHQGCVRELTSREALQHVLDGLSAALFPTHYGQSDLTDESGNLLKGHARHPIVEDDLVIYAGATVLGRITIGKGSTIGGNVWLTHSVPPRSNISQAHMRND